MNCALNINHSNHLTPITMYKNCRKYNATVSLGYSKTLQGDGSDVSLTTHNGAHRVFMTRVHTDHSRLNEVIPDEDCLVGPLVEAEYIPLSLDTSDGVHILRVPHYVQDEDLWKYDKVR